MITNAPNGQRILVNPTFEECLDFLHHGFDTLRIGVDEPDFFAAVNGLGATHRSIARYRGEVNQCRPNKRDGLRYDHIGRALVLYYERGRLWINDEELDGEYTRPEKVLATLGPCREYMKNLLEAAKMPIHEFNH